MKDRKLKQDILSAVRKLKRPEDKVYLVGGAIRDQILGNPIHDLDFAVSGNPTRLAHKVSHQYNASIYVMDDLRQTVRVILNKSLPEPVTLDYALLRGSNIEEDLNARDFTFNAIAIDIEHPKAYIDPLNGKNALKENKFQLCSPTSLKDDPLRVLRAVRFSVNLGLTIPSDLKRLIKLSSISLNLISPERKRDELFQILSLSDFAEGFRLMDKLGIFDLIFPELAVIKQGPVDKERTKKETINLRNGLRGMDEIFNWIFKLGRTSQMAVMYKEIFQTQLGQYFPKMKEYLNHKISADRSVASLLRFGGLYSMLCPMETVNLNRDRLNQKKLQSKDCADLATDQARKLKLSNREINFLDKMISHKSDFHFLTQSNASMVDRDVYQYFKRTGDAGIAICLLTLARGMANHKRMNKSDKWQKEIGLCKKLFQGWWQKPDQIVNPTVLITGDELQERFGILLGPQIGVILESLKEAQASGDVKTHKQAIAFVENCLSSTDLKERV